MGAVGGNPAKLPELPLLGPSPEGTEPDARMGGPFMLGEGDCSGDAEGDRSCSSDAASVANMQRLGFSLPIHACACHDCLHALARLRKLVPKAKVFHKPSIITSRGQGQVQRSKCWAVAAGRWQHSLMHGPSCRAPVVAPHTGLVQATPGAMGCQRPTDPEGALTGTWICRLAEQGCSLA